MAKKYILYCDPCGFKKIVQDPTKVDLTPAQTTQVQGGIPYIDRETKKLTTRPDIVTMPKYKCPSCGRVVTARKYLVPDTPTIEATEKQDAQDSPG